MTNTKARNQEIQAAAMQLVTAAGVDVGERVELRPLAKQLAEQTGCHYTTAKQHVIKAVRRLRHPDYPDVGQWGGSRGGGRPRKEENPV